MFSFQISLHSVTHYRPKVLKHKIDNRQLFSVCLVFEGKYRYTQNGEELFANPGSAIFLPKGAKYAYHILTPTEKTLVGQITFDFEINDSKLNLPDGVTVIERADILFDVYRRIRELSEKDSNGNALKLGSLILRLLTEIALLTDSRKKDFLSEAAEYISQNQHAKISVSSIAKKCGLSESQFRKQFIKRYGTSPIKYKNRLRIEAACRLLESKQYNVAEVSELLSFDTPYAFSKAFKSVMGVSPKKYALGIASPEKS